MLDIGYGEIIQEPQFPPPLMLRPPLEAVAEMWSRESEEEHRPPPPSSASSNAVLTPVSPGYFFPDQQPYLNLDVGQRMQSQTAPTATIGATHQPVTQDQMRALTGLPSPPLQNAALPIRQDLSSATSSEQQQHHAPMHGSVSMPDAADGDLEAYHLALGRAFSNDGLDFFDLDFGVLPETTIPFSALGMSYNNGVGGDEDETSGHMPPALPALTRNGFDYEFQNAVGRY